MSFKVLNFIRPKYPVGCRIVAHLETPNGEPYDAEGHVVIVMLNDKDELIYYCSMYPGAENGFEYIHCVDLNGTSLDDESRINTLQALNSYKEDILDFADKKTERKMKLKNLEK